MAKSVHPLKSRLIPNCKTSSCKIQRHQTGEQLPLQLNTVIPNTVLTNYVPYGINDLSQNAVALSGYICGGYYN